MGAIGLHAKLSANVISMGALFYSSVKYTGAPKYLDTKRVVNCGLTTRFDAISSTEIFRVINKPQQLHTNYTTRN